MTILEIANRVADRVGAPADLTWGFAREIVDEIITVLDSGEPVKMRDLGTLKWVPVKEKEVCNSHTKAGVKVKFFPAKKFSTRRVVMEDEGMTKYGVALDESKTKEASKKPGARVCPSCDEGLDSGGACPSHGTKPLEQNNNKQ